MDLEPLLYLAPSVAVLYLMAKERTFYLKRFSRLLRPRREATLADWLTVYHYLGLRLESATEPSRIKPKKPLRMLGAAVLAAASAVLFFLPLPFSIPFAFAQYRWDLFPLIKPLVAGTFLALSLPVAFSRWRAWFLTKCEPPEYPFVGWKTAARGRNEPKEAKR